MSWAKTIFDNKHKDNKHKGYLLSCNKINVWSLLWITVYMRSKTVMTVLDKESCSNLANSSLKVACFCSMSCNTFLDTTTCCRRSFSTSCSMASQSSFGGNFCRNHKVCVEQSQPPWCKEPQQTPHHRNGKYCPQSILKYFSELFSLTNLSLRHIIFSSNQIATRVLS